MMINSIREEKEVKKALSKFLFIAAFVVLIFAFSTNAQASGGLDQITAGEQWSGTWSESEQYKYVYLTVDQTGYYDLVAEDLAGSADLSVYLSDLDSTFSGSNCYDTYRSLSEKDGVCAADNMYLIAGHMYEIRMSYGYYTSDYYWTNMNAEASIVVTYDDYQNITMTNGVYVNLTAGSGNTDWLEFRTSTEGDYIFEMYQTADVWAALYEKQSGEFVDSMYFYSYQHARVHLKANTEYLLVTNDYETSAKLVRIRVSKAAKDIANVEVVQNTLLLPNHGYDMENTPYLYWSFVTNSSYKLTFTDQTTTTQTYSEMLYNGITINDIYYWGPTVEQGGETYFDIGYQDVLISYMNGQYGFSSVYITSYVEWCSSLNPATDYDDMRITYEDEGEYEYFWRLIPDETNNYEFYSNSWSQISAELTIFDKNNKIVERANGWNLVGGEEYSLRIRYSYNEYCSSDVEFWLEPHRDHIHSFGGKKVTKATLTANGKVEYTCSSCGYVDAEVICRPTTFTLSTVNYTYNGAVKKPAVTVKDANGKTLVNGTDYTVTYPSGRVNPGSYTVTVTMKGNYSGTKKLTFNIKLATPTVKASNAVNGVKITWNKVAGAANYRVYKSVYSGGKWSDWKAIKTGVTGTSYTDTTVKSADNVRYTVRAFNGSHSSAFKASNSIKFLATPTVKVANAANGVKITWNKVTGAKSYIVYRSVYSGGKWSGWTRVKTGATGTSYTDTTVKSGATVRYTVKAINGNFTSYIKASNTTKFLAQPTVKVAKTTNGIKASWGKSAGATGYIVYRRTYSNGKWSGWTKIKTTTALSFNDTTAKKGVYYQYTVRAYSGNYKSTYKNSSSIKR